MDFLAGIVTTVAVALCGYSGWRSWKNGREIAAEKARLSKALRIIASLAEEIEARQPMADPKSGTARALAADDRAPLTMERVVASLRPEKPKRQNLRAATYEEEWALEQKRMGYSGCDDTNPELSRKKAEQLVREFNMTREQTNG